ncbi:E3 ISG15--protein ligase herc5 [Mortierella polycephala]|uniref:E3 ISG15--protein ligase herc5 n=1 Tax=Mortierella polycephala TaxID=41804 RepID=A0A9P6QEM2_9FUNG|nr:E3 ISG15--protein ligase herc5 [Mortierella polycephala]
MFIAQATRAHVRKCALISHGSGSITPYTIGHWSMHARSRQIQSRPFLSWLLNPKEEPVVPKQLTPLKLEDPGSRLLFWDSTHTSPHLKPEFNERTVSSLSTGIAHSCAVVDGNVHAWGSNYYSQVGLTTESFHDDDSEEVTDVHFVNQLANEEIVQVASGNFHNLALSKTGKLWSWGSGCLGRGDEIYDSLPQPVEFFHALGRDIKQVFAAGDYSMALVTPKNGQDDELYIWGYIPFGEESEDGQMVSVMKKSLRPLLVTSVLGHNISHVACSPWHFTIAATPVSDSSDQVTSEKPLLMTFGRYNESLPLEKPYSPLFLDLPPEDEFYDIKPWRTFRSVSPTSELVIKKVAASKDFGVVDIAGGSSEVIAISTEGQALSWREPLPSSTDESSSIAEVTTMADDSLQARFNVGNMSPSALHPLQDSNRDRKKAETEVLAFFDSQRKWQKQKQTIRLVEALFESSTLVVEKPGLSKCVAQYDRFAIC